THRRRRGDELEFGLRHQQRAPPSPRAALADLGQTMNRISRRRFLAASATAAVAGLSARSSHAHPGSTELRATRRVIEVNRKAATVFGLNQPDGRHGIVAEAGQRFHVQLVNELDEHTLVHWHGLTPPSDQDGVPELSQPALDAGSGYEYDFILARPGTNWMHSHVGLQ